MVLLILLLFDVFDLALSQLLNSEHTLVVSIFPNSLNDSAIFKVQLAWAVKLVFLDTADVEFFLILPNIVCIVLSIFFLMKPSDDSVARFNLADHFFTMMKIASELNTIVIDKLAFAMGLALKEISNVEKLIIFELSFSLFDAIDKIAFISRLDQLIKLIWVQKGLKDLSMRQSIPKTSHYFHTVFLEQKAIALKLRQVELASIITPIRKNVNTFFMVFGRNKCARFRLLKKPFIIRKIRVNDSAIPVRLALLPVALVDCRFFVYEIYGTVADDLFDCWQFCVIWDGLLILEWVYFIMGYRFGNLFFRRRAYFVDGALVTWLSMRRLSFRDG